VTYFSFTCSSIEALRVSAQQQFESLIQAAVTDGVVSEPERRILLARGQELGFGPEEVEIFIQSKIAEQSVRQQTVSDTKELCPNCGKEREPYLLQCLCKHWFTSARPNSTLEQIYRQLQIVDQPSQPDNNSNRSLLNLVVKSRSVGDATKKTNVVTSIQIPNTKEDVLEIIALAVSQAEMPVDPNDTLESTKLRNAWIAKGEQAIVKASVLLKDDESVREFLENSAYRLKAARKIEFNIPKDVLLVLLGLAILVAVGWYMAKVEDDAEIAFQRALDVTEHQIDSAIAVRDYDQALVLVERLVWTHKLSYTENQLRAEQYTLKRESLKKSILEMRSSR
jgi:hypothetical protein